MIIKHVHGPGISEVYVNDVVEHQLPRVELDSAIIATCERVRKGALAGEITMEMLLNLFVPDDVGRPWIQSDDADYVTTESVYIV
jgi:hypothetical protein